MDFMLWHLQYQADLSLARWQQTCEDISQNNVWKEVMKKQKWWRYRKEKKKCDGQKSLISLMTNMCHFLWFLLQQWQRVSRQKEAKALANAVLNTILSMCQLKVHIPYVSKEHFCLFVINNTRRIWGYLFVNLVTHPTQNTLALWSEHQKDKVWPSAYPLH